MAGIIIIFYSICFLNHLFDKKFTNTLTLLKNTLSIACQTDWVW